jgi:hypothetical protein
MPRLRFTLRVVLVVTAIAAVVAWQYGTVLKRKESLRFARGISLSTIERMSSDWADGHHRPAYAPNVLRRLLGDEAYGVVLLQPSCTDEELARSVDLFPEALVQRAPYSW